MVPGRLAPGQCGFEAEAVEQADAADEGRLEARRSIMVGLVTAAQGKVVRPSQLIRSVLLLSGWTTQKKPPRVWTRRDGSEIPRTGCAAPNVWTAVTGYGGRGTLVSKCIS